MIPAGQNKYIQPLDKSINKPFKDAIHRQYTEFKISNGNTKKPSQEKIIDFVHNTVYSDCIINEGMIKKSFKVCRISNNMDDIEDDLFNWPDEINPEIDIINEITKDDY